PGPILTEFFSRHGLQGDEEMKVWQKYASKTLLQRPGKPQEISAMIRSLASDDASFVTGANLVVDGGLTISPPS
ncbi:hypothetical protein AAVH_38977, partial [Aphelenchoides avenae]